MSTESTEPRTPPEGVDPFETANDRFKKSFGSWFWGSMVAATIVHFAVMAFWPNLTASDMSFTMDDIEAIDLPPEIEIPPPPEQIQRPASPVVTDAQIDEDITIAPTTFEDNLPDDLPPPRTDTGGDLSQAPTFTPHEVIPRVKNPEQVQRMLRREYPSMLRDTGIGGAVELHFFIDERGQVQNALVAEGSGYAAFDEAALRVARIFEFTPALNRDQPVPVWITMTVRFEAR
jgi:periplasmic protein TonB